jgi:apolipoprotein N-acyltransferase
MQTLGYSSERTGSAPAASLLERAGWLEKLPLTLICGALLGFSSAGYGVWWLGWVGLAPLMILIFGSRSRTEATVAGLLFGLAYHLVALHWLFELHPMDWLGIKGALSVAVAVQIWFWESFHQSLLTGAFALFVYSLPMRAGILPHWHRPRFPFLLSVPLIWIFLQWVVAPSPWFMGVPLDQLAYSQARVPEMVQIARFGGAQAVDFLLVLFNCALAALVIDLTFIARPLTSRADVMSDRLGAIFDFILVAAIAYGLNSWGLTEVRSDAAMPQYWPIPKNAQQVADSKNPVKRSKSGLPDPSNYAPAIPIAIVAANIPIEQNLHGSGTLIAQRYSPYVHELGASIVFLPAGVLGGETRGLEPLRSELPKIATSELKDIVLGVRESRSDSVADLVKVITQNGHLEPSYMKYRLVPFAEYTPLGPLAAIVPQGLQQKLLGSKPHARANELPVPKTAFGSVGASFATELVYPDLIVSEVNRGASLLANISDLSAFHGSMLSQELIAAAVLRAVENGRYIVIASNGGISAVVDPHGVVSSSSLREKSGVIFDRVQFFHRKTPFTRMCLWTPLYH